VFDIRLQTMTKSTWKILKSDWKTRGIFFIQKSGNPALQLQIVLDNSVD